MLGSPRGDKKREVVLRWLFSEAMSQDLDPHPTKGEHLLSLGHPTAFTGPTHITEQLREDSFDIRTRCLSLANIFQALNLSEKRSKKMSVKLNRSSTSRDMHVYRT